MPLVYNQSSAEIVVNYPNKPGQPPTVLTFPGRSLVDVGEGLTHRAANAQAFTGSVGTRGTQIENLTNGEVRPLDHQNDGIRQLCRRAGLLRETDDYDEVKDAALAAAPHFQRLTGPRYVARSGVRFDPGNTPFEIRANGQALLVGASDLDNITAVVVQVTDAGEADLVLEHSLDGISWAQAAAYTEASFAAGDGAAVAYTHSLAANGRSLPAVYFRLRCAGMDVSGGVYALTIGGVQRVEA
jgi:hypothetical protein